MTIEELKALFAAAYQNKKLISPHRETCDRPLPAGYSHHIYSYAALPELTKKLKTIIPSEFDDEDDTLCRVAVRYTVDTTGTIWFAKEGKASGSTPDHALMCKSCYSAGNIYFSDDYKCITRITNKSGHFRPSPDTLIWSIAALLSLDAPFAESLKIVIHTLSDSEVLNNEIELSADQLLSLLPEGTFPESSKDFMIQVHTKDDFIVHSKPIGSATSVSSKRLCSFFSESETDEDERIHASTAKKTRSTESLSTSARASTDNISSFVYSTP